MHTWSESLSIARRSFRVVLVENGKHPVRFDLGKI